VNTFGSAEIEMFTSAVSNVLGVDKSRIKDVKVSAARRSSRGSNKPNRQFHLLAGILVTFELGIRSGESVEKFSKSLTQESLTTQLQSAGLTNARVLSVDAQVIQATPIPAPASSSTVDRIMYILVAVCGVVVLLLVLWFICKVVFKKRCWGRGKAKENRIHQDPSEGPISVISGGDAEREKEARTIFMMMDKDGNKGISHMELEIGLNSFGFSSSEIEEILYRVFSEGNEEVNELTFEQFREAVVPLLTKKMAGKEEAMALALFKHFDADGSGAISSSELDMAMSKFGFSSEEIDQIMHEADDGSGEIDLSRFKKVVLPYMAAVPAGKQQKGARSSPRLKGGGGGEEGEGGGGGEVPPKPPKVLPPLKQSVPSPGVADRPAVASLFPQEKGGEKLVDDTSDDVRDRLNRLKELNEGDGRDNDTLFSEDLYRLIIFDGGDTSLGMIEIKKNITWKDIIALLQSKFHLHELVGLKYVDPRENSQLNYSRNEEEWKKCLEVLCAEEDRELEVDLVTEPVVKAFRIKVPVTSEVDNKPHKKKIYFTNFYDQQVTFVLSCDSEYLHPFKETRLHIDSKDKCALIVRVKKMDKEHEEIVIAQLTEEQSKIIHTLKLFVTWS